MTAAATQVIIRHLSGSKTNQLEQFNLEGLSEITLGRDPSSRIAFDLQRDDFVSRKHAVIRVKNEKEVYFRLADLNSSNGTFLNGERISGEVELLPDDLVELGSGGPKFVFDVQPRPANLPARTRQMAAISAIEAAATRVVGSTEVPETTEVAAFSDSSQQTAARDPSAMAKVPVGKATILRMLTEERGKTRQVWIAAIAAVVLLAIVGGGALYWHGQSVANQLAQQLAQQQAVAEANKRQAEANLQQEMGITPEKIKQLGELTVYIRNQWQLYDRATNRPIYQKMANVDGEWLPCYVRMDDGSLVRWLTLDNDKDNNYEQIGGNEIGSGFVIGSQGAIPPARPRSPHGLPHTRIFPIRTARAARFSISAMPAAAIRPRVRSTSIRSPVGFLKAAVGFSKPAARTRFLPTRASSSAATRLSPYNFRGPGSASTPVCCGPRSTPVSPS